jgi:hypothetical protein
MRNPILTILAVLVLTTSVYAQKKSTLIGDTWTGVVESTNEATREITIVNPDKKTETFVGVLKEGYQVKMKDGSSRELKISDLKPGLRVRFLYKSTTVKVDGREAKVKLINRVDFLGRDDFTRLREMLKLPPSIPVSVVESGKLPEKKPLKLYMALEQPDLAAALMHWAYLWDKENAAKHGGLEIVEDRAQADVSLVSIWGSGDDPLLNISLFGASAATFYLATNDDNGVQVLWQHRRFISNEAPEFAAKSIGKELEKKLKARSK